MPVEIETDLPLRYDTPLAWAHEAMRDPLALLNDHAHLEKKAASNALELLCRWPEPNPPENWVAAMTAIARDEAEHLGVVTKLIARRGGKLTRTHRNAYALALRKLVRLGKGTDELVDRLLVSALIEARSCERFALLAQACDEPDAPAHDPKLAKLYRGLWASEHGHYRMFVQLAEGVVDPTRVADRWSAMLDAEAAIIQSQPAGPRMHSGI